MENSEIRRREGERAIAVRATEGALEVIAQQGREPDAWEREALAEVIGAIFRGAYRLATVEAAIAQEPTTNRSAEFQPDPAYQPFDLARLQRGLSAARAEPVRPYPFFGPMPVGRG